MFINKYSPNQTNWSPKEYAFKPIEPSKNGHEADTKIEAKSPKNDVASPKTDHASPKNGEASPKTETRRGSSTELEEKSFVESIKSELREAKAESIPFATNQTYVPPKTTQNGEPTGLTGKTLLLCPKGYGQAYEGDKCPFGFKRGQYQIEGIHFEGDKLFV